MNRTKKYFLTAAAILLAGRVVVFAQTGSSSRLDFNAFKTVADRNIFNPNRSSRSARSERPPEVRRQTPRVEAFGLAGTMSYEKGDFAFFDGTSSQFRKSAGVGDSVAGCKVLEITATGVKLAVGTNHVEVPVGMQLRREDEGDWILSATGGSFASGGGRSSARAVSTTDTTETTNAETPASATDAPAAEAASASSGGEDEVLKKLMQKREQEMNNP